MQKSLIVVFVILSVISVAFVVISLFVFLTRGKNSSLIGKKLLIGGLILTLTAMVTSCSNNIGKAVNCYVTAIDEGDSGDSGNINDTGDTGDTGDNGEVLCYDVAIIFDDITINNTFSEGAIQLNLSETNIISGLIENRKSNEFSFRLSTRKDEKPIQIGNIYASDGVFDENDEEYNIEIDKSTPKGEYIIHFYNMNVKKQESNKEKFIRGYYVNIK